MSGVGLALSGLRIATRFPRIAGAFGAIPKPVWEVVAVIGYALALIFAHQHYAHAAIAAARTEQRTADQQAFAAELAKVSAEAQTIRRNAEQLSVKISNINKGLHDAQISDHARTAGALLLRGPGAAAAHCRPVDHPTAAAVAGGREQPAANADAGGSGVLAADGPGVSATGDALDQFAIVPWAWLVGRAREHDDLLSDEITRRKDDAEQRAAWEKMRSAGTHAAPATAPPKR